jgi:hypothetical protein
MSWTIRVNGAGGLEFSAVNITGARRNRKILATDTFTFSQALDVTDTPICVYLDSVIIFNGETIWFQGQCTVSEPDASGKAERWNIEISGGVYFLNITPFLQPWAQISGGPYDSSRVVMGYKVSGGALVYSSVGDVITEVMGYATSNPGPNVPLQLGACALATFSYPQEFLNASCAEVIQRNLQYTPDVVCWVDYTTTPPTINFKSRFTLPTVTQSFLDVGNSGFKCKPRPDLIPPQVVIIYEVTAEADGVPGVSVLYDAVPPGSTGNAQRALVMTIPLHGVNETFVKQWLSVKTIPLMFSSTTTEDLQTLGRFYKIFVQQFKLADAVDGDPQTPDLTFYPLDPSDPDTFYELSLANPDGVDGDGNPFVYSDPTDTTSTLIYLDDTLTNALLQGNIMPWMTTTAGQQQTVKFRASWMINGVPQGIDPLTGTPGITCYATFTATNGLSMTYHDLQAFEAGESAPTGLAAALMASLSPLQYEGQAALTETECSDAMPLGKVLNITDGRPVWAAMAAGIFAVDEDIDHGITTAKFGPAPHLELNSMIGLLRMGRPAGDWDTRAAGANAQPQLTGLL